MPSDLKTNAGLREEFIDTLGQRLLRIKALHSSAIATGEARDRDELWHEVQTLAVGAPVYGLSTLGAKALALAESLRRPPAIPGGALLEESEVADLYQEVLREIARICADPAAGRVAKPKADAEGPAAGLIAGIHLLAAKLAGIDTRHLDLKSGLVIEECLDLCGQLLGPRIAPGAGKNAARASGGGAAGTVLVIDDDAAVGKLLEAALGRHGVRVICRNDPVEALGRMEDWRPDVVLVELQLPRLSGLEVIRNVAQRHDAGRILIIAGSMRAFDHDRTAALDAGAAEFLPKPYNLHELVTRTLRHLSRPLAVAG